MVTGRPKSALLLADEERAQLERWARRPKSSQRLAQRATIILECAKNLTNGQVAENLQLSPVTVGKWRARFCVRRLDGLVDEPRPGAPRKIRADEIERVVTKTLETRPENATHWSIRTMAQATGLKKTAIHRIWQAFGLKPHLTESFKLSEDPQFIEKVRDITGLYLHPPERAIVLSVDEKSHIQALNRTQPLLPLEPWEVERHTPDYERNGTTSLFAALNTKTGEVIGQCHQRHRQHEFLKFLKHLDATLLKEPGVEIHLILDNYGTHKTPAVKKWFLRHPEYHLHFTPTSASWLNMVERFFAEITTQRLRRGVFRSVPALKQAILDYLAERNANPKPFIWTADADLIFERVQRVCERINEAGH